MRPEDLTPDERLINDLLGRIRTRTVRGETLVLWLDLRGKKWGDLGKITLRDPTDPEWPKGGESTHDHAVAERWIRERYLSLLGARLRVSRGGKALATVEDAAEAYLHDLLDEVGGDASHNSFIGHRGLIRNHIVPAFGRKLLIELDRAAVQPWVKDLMVGQGDDRRPASEHTKKNVVNCLRAVWNHHHAGYPPPWGTIRASENRRRDRTARAHALRAGIRPEIEPKPLAMSDVARLMRAAYKREGVVWSSGPARAMSIPYAATGIALILCTGARITEATWIRWKDVWTAARHLMVCVPGPKSAASYAFVPLQRALSPWLERAYRIQKDALGRPPGPEDLILQNDRSGYRHEPMSRHTLGPMIDKALEDAGLKIPGRSAHALRGTFSTTAIHMGIPADRVKQLLRHSVVAGGVTDAYVRSLAKNISPSERRIMDCLPSPGVIEAGGYTWTEILDLHDNGRFESNPLLLDILLSEALPASAPSELARALSSSHEGIRDRARELIADAGEWER